MGPETEDFMAFRQGSCNSYLMLSDGEALLVDPGKLHKVQFLFRKFGEMGITPGNVKHIVLTHTHYDHVEGLSRMAGLTGARVWVHGAEADFLAKGYTPFPKGTKWLWRKISWMGSHWLPSLARYPGVTAHMSLSAEAEITLGSRKARLIPTPGHTAGSLTVLFGNRAMVGDTLFHILPGKNFPPFADEPESLAESWKKLLSLPADWYYPGHGKPIPREVLINSYLRMNGEKNFT